MNKTNPADLRSLHYLTSGTPRQRRAYEALTNARIFEILAEFSPVLAGTIPLDIDIAGSDLDVICQAGDLNHFANTVRSSFKQFSSFNLASHQIRGVATVIASFELEDFAAELFCQAVKVTDQYAVIHLLTEQRLLKLGGQKLKDDVRAFKNQGMKTEPAFARCLGLVGDPYDALARLAAYSDDELATLLTRR